MSGGDCGKYVLIIAGGPRKKKLERAASFVCSHLHF